MPLPTTPGTLLLTIIVRVRRAVTEADLDNPERAAAAEAANISLYLQIKIPNGG